MVVPNWLISGRESFRYLYAIAEKGREYDRGTDDEQARPDQRDDGLDNILITGIPFDVNLERGHDDTQRGDGVTDIQDIQHVGHYEIVHRGQCVRTPTVIHAAAFGHCRAGDDRA